VPSADIVVENDKDGGFIVSKADSYIN